jgi:hypothetical protein
MTRHEGAKRQLVTGPQRVEQLAVITSAVPTR